LSPERKDDTNLLTASFATADPTVSAIDNRSEFQMDGVTERRGLVCSTNKFLGHRYYYLEPEHLHLIFSS
jgi:hypothetical protein